MMNIIGICGQKSSGKSTRYVSLDILNDRGDLAVLREKVERALRLEVIGS